MLKHLDTVTQHMRILTEARQATPGQGRASTQVEVGDKGPVLPQNLLDRPVRDPVFFYREVDLPETFSQRHLEKPSTLQCCPYSMCSRGSVSRG